MSAKQPDPGAGGGGSVGGWLPAGPRARRVLFSLGCAWEAGRFLLVLRVMSVVVSGGAGHWLVVWLLFGCSGSLLTAACAALLAAVPDRHAPYLWLLRLGKALGLFTLVILAFSGGLGGFITRTVPVVGLAVPLGHVMEAVFGLDLLSFALYTRIRVDTPRPVHEEGMGGFNETEVGHYH